MGNVRGDQRDGVAKIEDVDVRGDNSWDDVGDPSSGNLCCVAMLSYGTSQCFVGKSSN